MRNFLKITLFVQLAFLCAYSADAGSVKFGVFQTSLVSNEAQPRQKIILNVESSEALEGCALEVRAGAKLLASAPLGKIPAGESELSVLLPEPEENISARWALARGAEVLAQKEIEWKTPRRWTLYILKSTHVDIGLHRTQYVQRGETVRLTDMAMKLADECAGWEDEAARYRYVIEGQWWWNNFVQERSAAEVKNFVENYAKKGLIGVGASHSGNHTQAFGKEELFRSAYYAAETRRRFGISSDAMIMADNNGLSWPMVGAYAGAGIKYLAFLPNDWNPPSVGKSSTGAEYDTHLPSLFYWQGADGESKLLVWTAPVYVWAAKEFGLQTCTARTPLWLLPEDIEPQMARRLAKLEERYPYDVWMVSNYDDNDFESTNLTLANAARAWNKKWRSPQLRTVGDLAEPFREVEKRFGKDIPVLKGAISGGWALHPLSTPELLAKKKNADRLLATAEKLSALAFLADSACAYPALRLRRAWDALVCNDEHGYGVSNYSGRTIYDTWLQKRAWIKHADDAARGESERALKALALNVETRGESVLVFNPNLQKVSAQVECALPESLNEKTLVLDASGSQVPSVFENGKLKFLADNIPSFGYALYTLESGEVQKIERRASDSPPEIENEFYRVKFGANGAMVSVFDKELGRELLRQASARGANVLVYSKDANKTFSSPQNAEFECEESALERTVAVRVKDEHSGAKIIQRVTLPAHAKRIDIDNTLLHVADLGLGRPRWQRHAYYAFEFDIPNPHFRVDLNGCDADAFEDQAGLGTDAYHAADTWAAVYNNDLTVALVQLDTHVFEFGKIREKKNTLEGAPKEGSMYSYLANDGLYEHASVVGPSHINLRARYSIISRAGPFDAAKVAREADALTNPPMALTIESVQGGKLKKTSHSFISSNAENLRLLTLKLAEEQGGGLFMRLQESGGTGAKDVRLDFGFGKDFNQALCGTAEDISEDMAGKSMDVAPFGALNLRLRASARLSPVLPEVRVEKISDNRAGLVWKEIAGAAQYNVYRGAREGFEIGAWCLLASVNGARYEDALLDAGKTYHYRVMAVDSSAMSLGVSKSVPARTLERGPSAPAKVGDFYNPLVSSPSAWRGDERSVLYLQWGKNPESDVAYYELYRSEEAGFAPSAESFVAKVTGGEYSTVVAYDDKKLKPHTAYRYRVRAVDWDGNKGEFSDEVGATTRELLVKK